jgi:hypothetical protein
MADAPTIILLSRKPSDGGEIAKGFVYRSEQIPATGEVCVKIIGARSRTLCRKRKEAANCPVSKHNGCH